jgi:hypothetical protein
MMPTGPMDATYSSNLVLIPAHTQRSLPVTKQKNRLRKFAGLSKGQIMMSALYEGGPSLTPYGTCLSSVSGIKRSSPHIAKS